MNTLRPSDRMQKMYKIYILCVRRCSTKNTFTKRQVLRDKMGQERFQCGSSKKMQINKEELSKSD